MLQCEVDLKTRRYFSGDIPETAGGVFIFDKNLPILRVVCEIIKEPEVHDLDEPCSKYR